MEGRVVHCEVGRGALPSGLRQLQPGLHCSLAAWEGGKEKVEGRPQSLSALAVCDTQVAPILMIIGFEIGLSKWGCRLSFPQEMQAFDVPIIQRWGQKASVLEGPTREPECPEPCGMGRRIKPCVRSPGAMLQPGTQPDHR